MENQTNGGSGSPALPCSPVPIRVQLSRKKGWRMPPNTVKVCRPGKWGNPFKVGVDGDAKHCVDLFGMDVCNPYNPRVVFDFDEIQQLRGKNLACWCKLGSPCHADVLIRLANASGHAPADKKPYRSEHTLNDMSAEKHTDSGSNAPDCSPSSTPDTDALRAEYLRSNLTETEWQERLWERIAELERDRDKWKAECKRQWMHLSQARHNARAIQNIRWGYEGDCGAARLANLIEEDCDRAMMSPENA